MDETLLVVAESDESGAGLALFGAFGLCLILFHGYNAGRLLATPNRVSEGIAVGVLLAVVLVIGMRIAHGLAPDANVIIWGVVLVSLAGLSGWRGYAGGPVDQRSRRGGSGPPGDPGSGGDFGGGGC